MKILALLILMVCSCTAIQHGNERYYYKKTVQVIDSLPDKTKQMCGYKFDRQMPTLETSGQSQYLVFKNEIQYNANRPDELVHEYQHFFNRQGVSWYCLNEVSASYAQRIVYLESLVDQMAAETKLTRRR